MPAKAFAFFEAREKDGAWYRVAPPLATSFMKSTAVDFCSFVTEKKLPDPDVKGALLRKVKFEVELVEPPTAKGKQKKLSSLQQPRPATVNFMDNNSLGEKEFLFSAYSAFRVVSIVKAKGHQFDHVITLRACPAGTTVPHDAPIASWH